MINVRFASLRRDKCMLEIVVENTGIPRSMAYAIEESVEEVRVYPGPQISIVEFIFLSPESAFSLKAKIEGT